MRLIARTAARDIGVPLTVVKPREPSVKDLYGARHTLIRPDQHVAWRSNTWPQQADALFATLCGHPERVIA